MARLPISLVFFVATLAGFAVQMAPSLGIHLTYRASAPAWSVYLVNIGMAALLAEFLLRRLSPLWLAIPALYFGGYYALYAYEAATLRPAESAASVPFDPETQALVIPADAWNTLRLQEFHRVPMLYTTHPADPEGLVKAQRLARREDCAALGLEGQLTARLRVDLAAVEGAKPVPDLYCHVATLEVPRGPLVLLERHSETSAARDITHWRLRLPDGSVHELAHGMTRMLKPFPQPMLGCVLNSSVPEWSCGASFGRDTRSFGDPVDSRSVASALGLQPVTQAGPALTDRETLQRVVAELR